jgi:hypothetical protein
MRFGSIGRYGLLVALVATLVSTGDAYAFEVKGTECEVTLLDDRTEPALPAFGAELRLDVADTRAGVAVLETPPARLVAAVTMPGEVPVRVAHLLEELAPDRRRSRLIGPRWSVANPISVRISSGVVHVRPRRC